MDALILREILNKAIEGRDPQARYTIGSMYFTGKGLVENEAEALVWYKLAADGGHADAQYALANIYHYGHGIVADECEALYYFQKAADQGHTLSQLMVDLISDKQEMANGLGPVRPLVASPFNPNQSERTLNQPGKDHHHDTK